MYREKIVNIVTGEESFRDYTAEEIAQVEAAQVEAEQRLSEIAEKEKARTAIFEKLGLSTEEIEILFGK